MAFVTSVPIPIPFPIPAEVYKWPELYESQEIRCGNIKRFCNTQKRDPC